MSDSLEFRLLKYIVAVAETSNFTRAAQRLFLAQPSLSKQIRDLEEEIKFPIFDRNRDGVRMTPAGEMILAYARETLRAREELVTMARAVPGTRRAQARLSPHRDHRSAGMLGPNQASFQGSPAANGKGQDRTSVPSVRMD